MANDLRKVDSIIDDLSNKDITLETAQLLFCAQREKICILEQRLSDAICKMEALAKPLQSPTPQPRKDNKTVTKPVSDSTKKNTGKRATTEINKEPTPGSSMEFSVTTDDGFTEVTNKRRKGLPKTNLPSVTPTANSFEKLTVSPMEDAPSAIPKEKAPPPVFLKTTKPWTAIAQEMKRIGINTKSSRATSDAIRIQPASVADYRNTVNLLGTLKDVEFYTFKLAEEKALQVVIRGLTPDIPTEEIKAELNGLGYPAESVYRIGKSSLVAVHLERNESGRAIYQLTNLCYLRVRVEAKRRASGPGQCHRCQQFGHSSARCFLNWRCVRCAEYHATAECTKKDKTQHKARCANCGDEHPASYRGCPKWPSLPKRPTRKVTAELPFAKITEDAKNPKSAPPTADQPAVTKTEKLAAPKQTTGKQPPKPKAPPAEENELSHFCELIIALATKAKTASAEHAKVALQALPSLLALFDGGK